MDENLTQLSAITNSTIDTSDVLYVVDVSAGTSGDKKMTYQNLMNPKDSIFNIVGSADTTKKVAFEVDGLTTATTRTVTVPDADLTMVGVATTQTLTNKALTSPAINLGTNATGDMYYRDSGGAFQRLPAGAEATVLNITSGIPAWIANPAASDASATVKGVVEIATAAEITAGTATGGTGAKLVISPDQLALATPVFNGSGLTNVVASTATKLDIVYTNVTSPGTTVETALYTKSIPANTLGTGNGIRLKIYFDTFTMTANGTFTWRFKYGSTTVVTLTVASATISNAKGYVEFVLLATGATNTQEGFATLFGCTEGVNVAVVAVNYTGVGTAAETSTGALNLVVTTESQNTGTLSGEVTLRSAILEKIY